jgi:hypothetical protein
MAIGKIGILVSLYKKPTPLLKISILSGLNIILPSGKIPILTFSSFK